MRAIPMVDLLDKVVGIGTCSGEDTDKFARSSLTPLPAKTVTTATGSGNVPEVGLVGSATASDWSSFEFAIPA